MKLLKYMINDLIKYLLGIRPLAMAIFSLLKKIPSIFSVFLAIPKARKMTLSSF